MARTPGLKTLPLDKVEGILAAERCEQWDVYAPLTDTHLEIGEPLAPPFGRYRLHLKHCAREYPLRFTGTSFGQLCAIARVPVTFLERVPAALGLKLLRCLLEMSGHAEGQTQLLRLKGHDSPRLRAVLPSSHVRLDDRTVFRELRQQLVETEARVANLAIDDDSFFIRVLLGGELALGTLYRRDPARAGLDLITSETGQHSLELRTVVLRLVCSNGMTQLSEGPKELQAGYGRTNAASLRAALRAAFDRVLDQARDMSHRLVESRSRFVEDPVSEVESLFRRHRLGSIRGRLGRWVLQELVREVSLFGVERFHICQAMTAVARGLDNRDRMRLEDAAGAYLVRA